MAFHVACPITCRRICFCELGFPRNLQASRSRIGFWDEVIRVDEFLNDPWGARISGCGTVQVPVPKVVPVPAGDGGGGADAADEAAALSAQAKRLALQRKATAAMVAAEDYARRVESGDIGIASRSPARDEHGQSSVNAICRMCFLGESEGSERARRMLSCRTCGKKYHRSCLKSWAQHRDLFHWSSWTCLYCRTCEVCRTTGDPTRLMFCKRCDDAYHCYCQHPSHKNVTAGPYLCPKHTRCHSCASTVPGNGLSVRWFLGYTCCDACGRLFVKGNYCPVCLKVYRDSESTPMVCCDVCQRWVHCQCDGISDEKYLQFQVDGNLQYKCATCRGECYQVKDLEDAVQELWRRKDNADKDLIVSLRAAAGLPTQEEIFSITPYSDDEENGPAISKSEFGRSLKFSLKGLVDKSPKKSKDNSKKSIKKYPKKKPYESFGLGKDEPCRSFDESQSFQSQGCSFDEDRSNVLLSRRNEGQDVSSVAGICSTNEPGVLKHRCVDDVMVGGEDKKSRVLKIKSNRLPDMDNGEDNGKDGSRSNSLKAKKLVINLGARKINVTNSPKSDASIPREQELVSSNGDKVGHNSQSRNLRIAGKEGNLIKFGKVKIGAPEVNHKVGRANSSDANEACPPEESHVMHRKVNNEGSKVVDGPASGVPSLRGGKIFSEKNLERRANTSNENNDDQRPTPTSNLLSKDSKRLLKFKFKKPNLENQNSQSPLLEEERSCIKGQRSKRKRPSPFIDKSFVNEDSGVDTTQSPEDNLREAGWILKKLGKDAAGKRVEVHQTSDNTWHKGTVTDVFDSTSQVSVMLDDGRVKTLELGEQSVRFLLQKQKRSKI